MPASDRMGALSTRDIASLALGIAVVALLAQAMRHFFERPKLRVSLSPLIATRQGTTIRIDVDNLGRRAALVKGWGLVRFPRGKPPGLGLDWRTLDHGPPTIFLGLREQVALLG